MIKQVTAVAVLNVLLSACSMGADKDKQATEALVDRAVALVESEGREAFPQFTQASWRSGEQYVFVMGMRKKILVHPTRPDLVGQPLGEVEHNPGRMLGDEFIAALATQDSAWVEYQWARPDSEDVANKHTYIKKATLPNGREFIVGSGYYTQ